MIKITKFTNNNDYEYINNGIKQKVKYSKLWTFDEAMQDYYDFNSGIYLNEFERIHVIG